MSKKLKEMAADAAAEWIKGSETDNSLVDASAMYGYNCGFLAGYQAAKDRLPPFHAGADVYIIDANNPLPKPMPLSIAEQNQFADTSKVMPDTCDHILDMEKMVDVNPSNNLNGWISVQQQMPDVHEEVLVNIIYPIEKIEKLAYRFEGDKAEWFVLPDPQGYFWNEEWVTHWMPLPAAPKEEE